MEIKCFLSPSFNYTGSAFYRLASGISKMIFESDSTFYSGAYLGSDEIFRHSVKQSQKLTFEGVYRSGETLHDAFITAFFQRENAPRAGLICDIGEDSYLARGKIEVEKLEINDREISVRCVFFPEGRWGEFTRSIYVFPEETAQNA